MTHKEIFKAALNHKNVGKVPVDFGATPVSGLHISCVDALRKYYGLEKRPVKLHEPYQMLGYIEDDLAEVMGIGVSGVMNRVNLFGLENANWKEFTLENGLEVLVPGGFEITVDANGMSYLYPEGDLTAPPSGCMPKGGYYFDAIVRQPPIDEDQLNVEDNLEEFTLASTVDMAHQIAELKRIEASGRGSVASFGGMGLGDIALVPATQLKYPKGIRDVEEWYISLVARQDYVREIFERQTEIALANLETYNEAVGDMADVVFVCGTDLGTQTSTFCSKDVFRSMYMPYYKKMNDWIHQNTNWKTFKHSCGAIADFIPLFIEAGFDILNPVQCSCLGMEPEKIKKDFGSDIVFWGGGIDTQYLLPFGKPEAVREQVLSRLEVFSKDGGYVFNAIHNVQYGTPIENIVAMIEAVKEYNR